MDNIVHGVGGGSRYPGRRVFADRPPAERTGIPTRTESGFPECCVPADVTGGFAAANPLQALKLAVAVVTIAAAVAGLFGVNVLGVAPGWQALVAVPFVGLLFVAVVAVETLYGLYRLARSEEPLAASLARRPGYALVRAVEVGAAVAGALVIRRLFALASEPVGPAGGVGLGMIAAGAGAAVLVASLGRCLGELYVYRRGAVESG